MVGIVIVSHSCTLAEGVVELCRMTAPNANMLAAGGMEDGGLGTSYEKIKGAVERADEGDGVLILADMGSSVMTAEMVLEDLDIHHMVLVVEVALEKMKEEDLVLLESVD